MKKLAKFLLHADLPLGPTRPLWRVAHRLGVGIAEGARLVYGRLTVSPVVRSLATGGKRLRIERIPYIRGEGELVLGDDIYISGQLGISFLRRDAKPQLKIGDRTFIGHECAFALSSRITIGRDCMLAAGTKLQDNDGHPLESGARRRDERVPLCEICPITIGDNVWIAPRCTILKGVTIGDNAVIGVGSVVTRDVPANTIVAGVPARSVKPREGSREGKQ